MDAQDKKELQEYVSRKPAPSMMVSLILHFFMIVFMLCYGLDAPEILKPIVIEMSPIGLEDTIEIEEEPYVNQAMVDWFAQIEEEQAAPVAPSILEPDFKPTESNEVLDEIINPVPQAGTSALTEVLPSELMTNLAPERIGSNTDMMDVGNPVPALGDLVKAANTGGYGGDATGDLARLGKAGAKQGEVTVSLAWDTRDDLDLHLIKDYRLPKKGSYNFKEMIYYAKRTAPWGELDVDMNIRPQTDEPVENIFMPSLPKGRYGVYVHLYRSHTRRREIKFRVLIQWKGQDKPLVIPGMVRYPQDNLNSQRVFDFRVP